MTQKFIFSGFGGQGVLTLGQIVALLAMEKGYEVTWLPSYGAEMRGGTANCSVIISDTVIGSPVVNANVDYLFVMNEPSLDKFIGSVRPGGAVIVNSSIVRKPIPRTDVSVYQIDAANIAMSMGNIKVQNLVMLAGYLKLNKNFSLDDLSVVLKKKFAGKSPEIVSMNINAVKMGLEGLEE